MHLTARSCCFVGILGQSAGNRAMKFPGDINVVNSQCHEKKRLCDYWCTGSQACMWACQITFSHEWLTYGVPGCQQQRWLEGPREHFLIFHSERSVGAINSNAPAARARHVHSLKMQSSCPKCCTTPYDDEIWLNNSHFLCDPFEEKACHSDWDSEDRIEPPRHLLPCRSVPASLSWSSLLRSPSAISEDCSRQKPWPNRHPAWWKCFARGKRSAPTGAATPRGRAVGKWC